MDNSKQQEVPLYSALEKFRRLRVVPFDVPGHKRGRGNDMYPLSWATRKEGIFVRYSYEFKIKCIQLYREGSFPEVPQGVSRETLRKKIWEWSCIEEKCGPEALKPKKIRKKWTEEEKLELEY